jgi:MOSC domain-containing protein YiiM
MNSPLQELLDTLPQIGRLQWIGLSARPQSELEVVNSAEMIVGHGLLGDHHAKKKYGAKRQVTLIQAEHVVALAGLLHRQPIDPGLLRRNLVVAGLNLLALKGKTFRIGSCLLEYSGPCEPCSQMERNLGPGGLNAMRGHGGITAKVLSGGMISLSDKIQIEPQS